MKDVNPCLKKIIFFCMIISLLNIETICQTPDNLNESIVMYRKGELVVKAKKGQVVTVEQLSHEFWFGCAIPNSLAGGMKPDDLKKFKEKFLENFNSAVTENALKWGVMEPQKDKENYAVIDSILSFTEKNQIPLRGHNLFWGILKSPNTGQTYVQSWVTALDDNELRQRIQSRAERITRRYKGRFAEYDLNNEMIHGNYFEDRLGPEITKQMAEWALKGDPDAKLYVNDYDVLITGSPLGIGLPEYMAHIRKILKQGIPIAGIGAQGHSHLETFDRQVLSNALDSLAKFNLPIRVTEFNLPGMRSKLRQSQLTPEQERSKAKEIEDYYRICFAHPAVEGILMWGFWEGANWIPSSSLYKRDWSPTPALQAYRNLVLKEWWTKESGTARKKGLFAVPAFYGKYRVTVNGVSKEIDLTKQEGRVVVNFRK
jgi:GH35 family endo-1,4-beta-xylanase